jgi:alkaline phosphatase D
MQRAFDLKAARSLSNPDLVPHLEFVDVGGHGYAKVRLSADAMRTEFVCIPRPITRSEKPDGGPLRYRVLHTAALWKSGERPQLKTSVLEGDAELAIRPASRWNRPSRGGNSYGDVRLLQFDLTCSVV